MKLPRTKHVRNLLSPSLQRTENLKATVALIASFVGAQPLLVFVEVLPQ